MHDHLTRMFQAGIDACRPERTLAGHLPPRPSGKPIVLAIGKAAAEMAKVAEAHYGSALAGVAVIPHGTAAELDHLDLVLAGHPIPDRDSLGAGQLLLELASTAGADDLVIALLSGGASALACLPGHGLALEEKRALTRALLASGAAIADVNCVRRHLSRIKGGRLALAARPAPLVTFAISDVVGDAPEDIGSGPTVPDPTTVAEAQAILRRHAIAIPDRGWSEPPAIPPRPFRVIANGRTALAAARREAERLGYRVVLLGESTGEARDAGRDHAGIALAQPPGTVLISGGELTVTVTGHGRGGPNTEYALAAAMVLEGRTDIAGLAVDTDGLDGTSGAAGAWFGGEPVIGAAEALAANDSAAVADLFVTGPTGTNVNDLRIILVGR